MHKVHSLQLSLTVTFFLFFYRLWAGRPFRYRTASPHLPHQRLGQLCAMPTPWTIHAAHMGLLLAIGTAVVWASLALESNLKASARDMAQLARDMKARDEASARDMAQLARDMKARHKTQEMDMESAEKMQIASVQQVLKRIGGLEQRLQAAAHPHANSAGPLSRSTGSNGRVLDEPPRTSGPFADRVDCAGSKWADLHTHFHLKGYAYFYSCSLNQKNKGLVDRLAAWVSKKSGMSVYQEVGGGALRVQDAWKHHAGVRDAAGDPDTLSLIACEATRHDEPPTHITTPMSPYPCHHTLYPPWLLRTQFISSHLPAPCEG